MGWTAAVVALWLHGSSPRLPVEERKPPPATPRPRPTKVVVFTCILDEPLPPPPLMTCHVRPPEIRDVAFLRPCPEWIDKMVAEADRL